MSARWALACLAVAGLPAAGCGEEEPQRPPDRVRLVVSTPADATVVPDETVTLRGRVRPAGADVRVRGESAEVDGRSWSAEVELEPGGNVIDVTGSVRGRVPAVAAVRVIREDPVRVPQLRGRAPEDARDELAALGLGAQVDRSGGLLDDLLPGDDGVCGTDPGAGEIVRPGTVVTIEVAKVC
jgi:hypothetical protein